MKNRYRILMDGYGEFILEKKVGWGIFSYTTYAAWVIDRMIQPPDWRPFDERAKLEWSVGLKDGATRFVEITDAIKALVKLQEVDNEINEHKRKSTHYTVVTEDWR